MKKNESWKNFYSNYNVDKTGFLKKRWYKLALNLLKKQQVNIKGKRVLEVGCGRGGFCDFLSDLGADVVGVDFDPVAIAKASMGRGTFFVCDARKLELPNETFDIVFCCEVLEHIPECQKVFAELNRVCKVSGLAVLTVPNFYSSDAVINIYYRFESQFFKNRSVQPSDVNVFTSSILSNYLELNGFKVLEKAGIGLLILPSKKVNDLLVEPYYKPCNVLSGVCLNIGVVAQKRVGTKSNTKNKELIQID